MPDDELLRFVRENRERYTQAAIRYQLRRAGHDPKAIEEVLAASDAELRAAASRDLRPHAALIMVAAYVGVWLIFQLFATLPGAPIVLGIFLVIAGLISLLFISSSRLRLVSSEHAATALLGTLVVPLLILVALAGLCVVTTDPFHRTSIFV